jgi:hypothetical protein
MERGSGKRSSSAGSEKMEKDGDRQKKMEGHCATGQSSHRAVVPVEEEELYLSPPSRPVQACNGNAFYMFLALLAHPQQALRSTPTLVAAN